MGFGCMILIMVSAFNAFFIMTRYGTHRHCSRNKTLWCPNEFVLTFFCIYSPAHAIIWQVTTSANWMSMFVIMALISKQVSFSGLSNRFPSAHDMGLDEFIGSSLSHDRHVAKHSVSVHRTLEMHTHNYLVHQFFTFFMLFNVHNSSR